jgi:hypothetical protein
MTVCLIIHIQTALYHYFPCASQLLGTLAAQQLQYLLYRQPKLWHWLWYIQVQQVQMHA